MPKFSLLIAHYNNFEYFVVCYSSLLSQTYKDYEIIIVDDFSNDGSFDRVKNLVAKNPQVSLFQNDKNEGVGFTKEKCIGLAEGEILGFVDPDDAITNDALEEIVKNYSSDEISAVYSQFLICDQHLNTKKVFINSKQIPVDNSFFFNIFLNTNHFFTFRKSAYEKTSGINTDLSSAVDQDLYLKLYETGKFKFVKKPLYLYRMHEKGVSQAKNKKSKLSENWHTVILDTLERRNINKLYNKEICEINNLPEFIYKKQNTIFARLLRKLKWSIFSLNLLTDIII